MIVLDVKINELFMQWTKTPAYVISKSVDSEGIEIIKRVPLMHGFEENEVPFTWAEIYDLIRQWIEAEDIQYLISGYPLIFGEPYIGEPSKYELTRNVFTLYFPKHTPPDNLEDLIRMFQWLMIMNGSFGVGCPNGCGRFIHLKLTEDLKSIEPLDINEKYMLLWKHDPELNTVRYKCDKCGVQIKLT